MMELNTAERYVDEVRKSVASTIDTMRQNRDRMDFLCTDQGWDSMIICDFEEAIKYLGYTLASLTAWNDEVDEGVTNDGSTES